jgi:hypothetical protein
MLLSAAEVALQKDDWVLFQAVIKAISPARRTRNDFAHHVWGSAAQIPDALLLVDPKYLTHYDVEVAVINAEMLTSRSIVTLPDLDMSLLMVWKRRDLEEARQIAKEALVITRELREGLDLSAPGLEIGGGTRQRLLNRPSIAQAFRRLADLTRSPEMPPLRG